MVATCTVHRVPGAWIYRVPGAWTAPRHDAHGYTASRRAWIHRVPSAWITPRRTHTRTHAHIINAHDVHGRRAG
ncbi:hypothetical protein C8R44DRAFT_805686 [Mycena epipterygia]|nr:hypothetical protein C8R44DRAFT_805686 [Mycena epipterygia]